jgi:hypothetical protein
MDSRPYRLYIGIAIAVVLGVAYVAWRNVQTSSQSSKVAPPPAATTQPVTPADMPSNPTKANVPADTPDRTSEPASTANFQGTVPSHAVPSDNSSNNVGDPRAAHPSPNAAGARATSDAGTQAASPTASPSTIDEKSLQAEPVSANGAEELAIAQRYLSGAEGQERNSAEAAKWLWKAIAKHNADASLLLSDLYLKGDGVEKNCDQARVLLDAAAGRGMKGAGDRLRHLQAFGCQ